jgi:hypothetical protein
LGLAVPAAVMGGMTSPSVAAWLVTGPGQAGGASTVMPTGAAPGGTVSGTTVTLSWAAAPLGNGATVAGYLVTRINGVTGGVGAVGGSCAGIVVTPSCTDTSVPAGPWVYTETPVQLSWTGGTSPASPTITVS